MGFLGLCKLGFKGRFQCKDATQVQSGSLQTSHAKYYDNQTKSTVQRDANDPKVKLLDQDRNRNSQRRWHLRQVLAGIIEKSVQFRDVRSKRSKRQIGDMPNRHVECCKRTHRGFDWHIYDPQALRSAMEESEESEVPSDFTLAKAKPNPTQPKRLPELPLVSPPKKKMSKFDTPQKLSSMNLN